MLIYNTHYWIYIIECEKLELTEHASIMRIAQNYNYEKY